MSREWRYTHDGVKLFSVTEVLKHAGLSKSYGSIPKHIMDKACARGTAIHTCAEELCQGREVDEHMLDESWLGYLDALKRWIEASKPDPIDMEIFVWSRSHRIGGRMDFFGKIGDEDCVIDFKTRAPDPVDGLQTAGYRYLLMLHYMDMDDEVMVERIKSASRYVVSFAKDGKVKTKKFDGDGDIDAFLAAAKVTWWKYENGRLK